MNKEYEIRFIDNLASREPEIFLRITADHNFSFKHLERLIRDLVPDTINIMKKEGSECKK